MNKFKVGDRVVCLSPANGNMEKYRGKEATVVKVRDSHHLELSAPFREDWFYTTEQFDLIEDIQENE